MLELLSRERDILKRNVPLTSAILTKSSRVLNPTHPGRHILSSERKTNGLQILSKELF